MILKGADAIGKYIGMSVPTFHRHKSKDRIPYFWAAHNICARTEDLDAWIDEQIEKEERKHRDGRKEKSANDASDDVQDTNTMSGLREEEAGMPRPLQRVRRVPEPITGNQRRAVRR